mgnify:CR=1
MFKIIYNIYIKVLYVNTIYKININGIYVVSPKLILTERIVSELGKYPVEK